VRIWHKKQLFSNLEIDFKLLIQTQNLTKELKHHTSQQNESTHSNIATLQKSFSEKTSEHRKRKFEVQEKLENQISSFSESSSCNQLNIRHSDGSGSPKRQKFDHSSTTSSQPDNQQKNTITFLTLPEELVSAQFSFFCFVFY
jgi:hypothetical protein